MPSGIDCKSCKMRIASRWREVQSVSASKFFDNIVGDNGLSWRSNSHTAGFWEEWTVIMGRIISGMVDEYVNTMYSWWNVLSRLQRKHTYYLGVYSEYTVSVTLSLCSIIQDNKTGLLFPQRVTRQCENRLRLNSKRSSVDERK